MKHFYSLAALLLCAACGGAEVKETLGLNRHSPDEFRVVSRPPLSVPKEFYLYPPNEAGEHAAVHKGTDAKSILFDEAVSTPSQSSALSGGEVGLLDRMDASKADSNIRETLRKEAGKPDDVSMLEKLQRKASDDPVVDAQKERERIQEAKKEGKALDGKDVPTLEENESTLDWLFN